MTTYYEILDFNPSDRKLLSEMNKLIKQDPNFFDPYTIIYDIYTHQGKTQEANTLLDKGYGLALQRILDKDGNFPDQLEWGWLENRHIIRIILRKGLTQWQEGDTKKALSIFRNLFNSNPHDNAGVRYYILAILEGLSYEKYSTLYENDGFMSEDIFEWFEKGRKKYADEFKALEE